MSDTEAELGMFSIFCRTEVSQKGGGLQTDIFLASGTVCVSLCMSCCDMVEHDILLCM